MKAIQEQISHIPVQKQATKVLKLDMSHIDIEAKSFCPVQRPSVPGRQGTRHDSRTAIRYSICNIEQE